MPDPTPTDPRQEITQKLPALKNVPSCLSSNQLPSPLPPDPVLPSDVTIDQQPGFQTVLRAPVQIPSGPSSQSERLQAQPVIIPFSDETAPMTIPLSPINPTSPKPSPSTVASTSPSAARGSNKTGSWFGRWVSALVGLVRKPRVRRAVFDPVNTISGCEANVEYVSRWALVEFGVSCPRCGGLAAQKGQFSKIIETTSGEAVQCADSSCRWLLMASPDTEHEDHLLAFDIKTMYKFSRVRHPMSPYSSQEAHVIRQSKPGFMEELVSNNPELLKKIQDEQNGNLSVTTSKES